jgi:hypothetical protein
MLLRLNSDDMREVLFMDEVTFHVFGKVNRYNMRIWGSENPSYVVEYIRDSPKVNVWPGFKHNIGPLFFPELKVTTETYLDMLQLFAVPHV